jgi:signal peptidase I
MKVTVPRIISVTVLLVVASAVLWAVRSVRTGLVPSESMEPELKSGDLLLIRTDAYRQRRTPSRGDIVLFQHEGAPDYFVKRVIGLPGETVIVVSGHVAIDGRELCEPYARQGVIRELPTMVRLGDAEYFLMGDNRPRSEDSRDVGPVSFREIRGKISAVIGPHSRRGRITNPFDGEDAP